MTTTFGISVTRGFAAVGNRSVAVCLLPGTELAFDHHVDYESMFYSFGSRRIKYKVARFRQVDVFTPHTRHDAIEFPDGRIVLLTRLVIGQTATVLQLPSAGQIQDRASLAPSVSALSAT